MGARFAAVLVFLILGCSGPMAQEITSVQAVAGSAASDANGPATAPTEVDDSFDILVIGDGLGGGLGAGFTRRAEVEGDFTVALRFNEESGIARPEVYDWSTTLPKILEGKAYDAVVVLLGSNDRQTIRADNLRHAFGSPEWVAAYRAQTDRILDTVKAAGAKIYWVSIPPMANPEYDEAMAAILQIQKERVEAKGAIFVDIRPAFLDRNGHYTDVGPDDNGDVRKLRASDGVSFFKQGNNRMAQLVLDAIKHGRAAPAAPVTLEMPQPTATVAPDFPMFGQMAADGGDLPFRPADPGVAAISSLIASGTVSAGYAALQSLSPAGSSAEKLFIAGEAVPAPRGRIDNFSISP